MDRQAVFQTVHPAGVFRHVAADGAGDLRGGIGRVIQAVRGGGLGDFQVADAGLQAGYAGYRIDLYDLAQASER